MKNERSGKPVGVRRASLKIHCLFKYEKKLSKRTAKGGKNRYLVKDVMHEAYNYADITEQDDCSRELSDVWSARRETAYCRMLQSSSVRVRRQALHVGRRYNHCGSGLRSLFVV
jgi:hypothetical protein